MATSKQSLVLELIIMAFLKENTGKNVCGASGGCLLSHLLGHEVLRSCFFI